MAWILAVVVFFLDISLRIFFGLGPASPDILLLALLYITLKYPVGEAYCIAFLSGFSWDTVFMDNLGLHSFLFVIAAMITVRLCRLIWVQYAISRLVIGAAACGLVRFGEVIFWLSNLDQNAPIYMPERYIITGAIVTGVIFFLMPWRTTPINLPRRNPQTIFAER